MGTDGRHRIATVGIGAWIDSLERRTLPWEDRELAAIALSKSTQLLTAVLGDYPQCRRVRAHKRNERVQVSLHPFHRMALPLSEFSVGRHGFLLERVIRSAAKGSTDPLNPQGKPLMRSLTIFNPG